MTLKREDVADKGPYLSLTFTVASELGKEKLSTHREKEIPLSDLLTVPIRKYQKWLDLNVGPT